MDKIKVFIVDDSATVRQVIGGILQEAGGIEVIGAAQDPIFALRRMEADWPDVIVLDVEMPRMDGLTFLANLMRQRPTPVVMCSTLTTKGSSTTMEAIRLGAVEIIAKPTSNLRAELAESSRQLVDAVRAAAKANLKVLRRSLAAAPAAPSAKPAALATVPPRPDAGDGRVVAIGTSTGGTQALEAILPRLTPSCPALVVVQHMPEKFTRAFAERLDSLCSVEVREAANGDRAMPGRVLIAPGGRHMTLARSGAHYSVTVKDGPPVSRHRPSVDVLFRSVARVAGERALGIIMTGMGDDGAAGLKEMREAGARTLGQNEDTCVIYGMPAVAARRGAVEREVALGDIASEIATYGAD